MPELILNGITWGHSRGITPLLAASQRFSELNPGIQINWKKRTLQEFADFPIEKLTEQYDLLIIDHPWVGCAAATECVLPLDQYISPEYLDDQLRHSVGGSHESYFYSGHQWALAIDAATPVASYRKDLFDKHQIPVPTTWEALLALAKAGRVAVPGIPIDSLMHFYSFCIAVGKAPFSNTFEVIDEASGILALEKMYELYSLLDRELFNDNPIRVAEKMSSGDQYWYCPFAYCYSNYSRPGYAKHLLTYTDTVQLNQEILRTTIGGTGLSVSAFSKHRTEAVQFAEYVCSADCQSGLYVQHGGQPGHLSAWKNELANLLTNDFFKRSLPSMERGYMRPRYNGYLHFQDHAGEPVQQFLMGKISAQSALQQMNQIYHQSLIDNIQTGEHA